MKSSRRLKLALPSALVMLGSACGLPEGAVEQGLSGPELVSVEQHLKAKPNPALAGIGAKPKFNCPSASNPVCNLGHLGTPPWDAHLGRGWNVLLDTDTPSFFSCLKPHSIVNTTFGGKRTYSKLEFVQSSTELRTTLDLGARISGSVPVEGIPVSGSLEGELLDSAGLTQDAINLVAYSRVTFDPKRIGSPPEVSDAMLTVFDQDGAREFREKCGDHFVDEVTPGGEFFASIQIYSTDLTVQKELKATLSLDVAGGGDEGDELTRILLQTLGLQTSAGLDADGRISTTFNGRTVGVRITTRQRGGNLTPNITTVGELLNRYKNFPGTVSNAQNVDVMGVNLKPYSVVQNFGTRNPFGINGQASIVNLYLAPAYVQLLDILSRADFALLHANEGMYFDFNVANVQSLRDEAALGLLRIEDRLVTCDVAVQPNGSSSPCSVSQVQSIIPNFNTLRSRLPTRKQFYTFSAKAFKAAVEAKGGQTNITNDGVALFGTCSVKAHPNNGNHVLIETLSGVIGERCDYELFKGARLKSGWDFVSMERNLAEEKHEQEVLKNPTRTNLGFKLFQHAYPGTNDWSGKVSATLKTFTLVGPPGDPSNALNNAIEVN